MTKNPPFASIEEAIEQFRQGRMVIIVDDEDRENEGDLAIAAEKVTPEAINFMARYGRGLICLALTEERCDELELPLMVEDNTSPFGTAFTVSIEARGKITTGISAADRAATILTAIDPAHPARGPAAARATSSRCAPARAACSSAPARPRPRSTSPPSPACSRPASSARS